MKANAPSTSGFFVLVGNVLSNLREPISVIFRCPLLSCSSSISSRLFNVDCRHTCLSQRSSKVKLKTIRKSMKSTFSWVLLFSIISIGDASIRAKAFTTHPAYSANRLEIFDGDKTEIRGCNGYAGPLKNPKPSINSAQSVKNIYARWNFGNSTAMGRVFVSKNGSIRSYPYTRNPQVNSWLSWKMEDNTSVFIKFNIESTGWEAGNGYGELYSISEDGVRLWSIPVYVGEGC